MSGAYTHRYRAYCRAHSSTPEEMLEQDKQRFHGGHMAGFIAWINQRWTAWGRRRGIANHVNYIKSDDDHADFDRFIGDEPVNAGATESDAR